MSVSSQLYDLIANIEHGAHAILQLYNGDICRVERNS